MKQLKSIILVLIIFLLSGSNFAQETTYRGNLLVIDMHSNKINLTDTVGYCEILSSSRYGFIESYEKIFQVNNNKYFLLSHRSSNDVWEWGNYTEKYLNNSTFSQKELILRYYHVFDISEPYLHFIPYEQKVENGTWILFGTLGNTFVGNNDSLYISPSQYDSGLVHIAGKIGNEYLIAYKEEGYNKIEYYLADLSSSPQLKNMRQLEITPNQEDVYMFSITKLYNIKDNVYAFLSAEGKIWIANFNDEQNNPVLDLIVSYNGYAPGESILIGNKVYTHDSNKLVSREINPTDFTLSDEEIVIDSVNYSHDSGFNSNIFAYIRNDSLIIYSLKEKNLINSFDLFGIDYYGNVVIDSPYVYVHQTIIFTGVEDEVVSNEFLLEQNYPNPFNPTTTIKFSIPAFESTYSLPQQTKLTVYDALGREVKILVNKVLAHGTYEVKFDASELSSGIYFYQLQNNANIITKKMILIR